MPNAIIFDIDGTLVDSNDLHASCWVETFDHFGIDISFEKVRGQIGKGGDQLLPALLSAKVIEEKGGAIQAFRGALFERTYMPQVRPFPGVKRLFERIKAEGSVIVLASSGQKDEVDQHIAVLGIADLIEAATTADDAESSKPAPDIFEAALARLSKADRTGALVIGDTPYDAEAAGKAGLRSIGLLCGGFSEQDLRAAGCFDVFQDPEDLLANFETSPLKASSRSL